jgi:predicted acyl esterase
MTTSVRLQGAPRAASRLLLAGTLLLGVSTAAFAQGAGGAQAVSGTAAARPAGAMGAGTEGRLWADPPAAPPPKPATPPYKITITEHVKIAMRDGVKLDAVLYTPERARSAGCILVADGYGWSLDPRDRRFSEQQGYAVLNVSYRGIGQSEGAAGLYDHYGEDGYDLIQWMVKQPWCADGNVGIFGSSLPGIAPWQIANTLPPNLKAIAPDVACADCYNYLWYPGGTLPGPGREDRGDHEYLTAIQHRERDAWWDKQIVDNQELAAIAKSGMGIMVSGGLQDYITPGNMAAFTTLQQAGAKTRMMIEGTAHFGARRSVLGPWHHETHMDLFFAHYLRGEKNAWSDPKAYKGDVLLWVMGPDKFRWEKSWPIADTRYAKLYLRAQPSGSIQAARQANQQSDDPNAGRINLSDGSLSAAAPAADERPMVYRYFPQTGPYLAAMRTSNDGWPKVDQAEYEARATSWTTGALTTPTEVTGNIVFDFSAAIDGLDADIVLMVTDVAPDGTSKYVSSGVINAPRYPDPSSPKPLTPGEVRNYQIVAQPIAYVFQSGHRIRFSVAGGTTHAPSQRAAQGPGKNAHYSQVTMFQNAERPASVTIPIIGTGALTSEVASAR